MKKIVIVAGDKSGDIYGGFLSQKLKKDFPTVKIYSFGGEVLAQHSKQIINLLSQSVCGLIEILSSLTKLINIFNKTVQNIKNIKPDLIILIDFPDFNLRLAKKLNKRYPLFYYISPQIWAWRKNRIQIIKEYVDKMIVIFKFEKEFYKDEGMDALYFGHPLLEIIKEKNIETKNIISFLPGSRKNELRKHLPIMKEAKAIMEKELKGYTFRIIRPLNLDIDLYSEFSADMDIVDHSYKAIGESKFIVSSSGTATVEITILEIPYVIIYKVNPISWQILKRLVKTKSVGMINILTSKKVVEELLQKDVTPDKIANITLEYLKNPEKYSKFKSELKQAKDTLSPYGATNKFADYIGQFLELHK